MTYSLPFTSINMLQDKKYLSSQSVTHSVNHSLSQSVSQSVSMLQSFMDLFLQHLPTFFHIVFYAYELLFQHLGDMILNYETSLWPVLRAYTYMANTKYMW